MLSEERVKLMTQMAIFEKNEALVYAPAAKYSKKDYLSHELVMGFIKITVYDILVYGIIVAALLGSVVENVTVVLVILLVVLGIILYLLTLFWYLRRTQKKAVKNYKRAAGKLKKLVNLYDALDAQYRKEEEDAKSNLPEDILHEI